MNSYFQLICELNCTKMKIYSPTNGGELLTVNEVTGYLKDHNVDFDLQDVNNAIVASAKGDVEFVLNNRSTFRERECYEEILSADKMKLTLRFYAPAEGGERMTVQEILRDMIHKGIRYGIKEDAVKAFVENPQYCTDIVVAEGKAARQGEDARVEYFFNTKPNAKPTVNEDGSVDFFHLNIFNLCGKGQTLAKLHPMDLGEEGKNVKGEVVKPRVVKSGKLHYGRNIELSEDGTEIYSAVDGHVSLVDGTVFVSDVLEVENVDPSTGNIEYEGSILIKGNVTTGYEVRVKGNIDVKGVVEGATLEAGGDIIIARGMNGMGRGTLKAGGNIIVKFMEGVDAHAEGYVQADSILHSNVSAGTRIEVGGKRGFIAGGKVSATQGIEVKTLGSDIGADTIIEVGADPSMKRRIYELEKALAEIDKNLASITPVLQATAINLQQGVKLAPDQLKNIQSLMQLEKQRKFEKEEYSKELEELQKKVGEDVPAEIVVRGTAYPGTKICISDVAMTVKSPMTYCRFVKERGDVKIAAI